MPKAIIQYILEIPPPLCHARQRFGTRHATNSHYHCGLGLNCYASWPSTGADKAGEFVLAVLLVKVLLFSFPKR